MLSLSRFLISGSLVLSKLSEYAMYAAWNWKLDELSIKSFSRGSDFSLLDSVVMLYQTSRFSWKTRCLDCLLYIAFTHA